jgi:hypothetical protein
MTKILEDWKTKFTSINDNTLLSQKDPKEIHTIFFSVSWRDYDTFERSHQFILFIARP